MRGLVDNVTTGSGYLGYGIIGSIKTFDKCSTIFASANVFLNDIAVCARQLKYCVLQRLLGFGVDLGDRQTRLLSILDGDRSCLVGGVLDFVRLIVQDIFL